jgi:hypothetical protein
VRRRSCTLDPMVGGHNGLDADASFFVSYAEYTAGAYFLP